MKTERDLIGFRFLRAVAMGLGLILAFGGYVRAATRYVKPNNPGASLPFTSWATAATNIQDAVDVALAGDTVLVTNGVYATGGQVVQGAITNRVAVTRPVLLASVNGPTVTVIAGNPDPVTTNGDAAVRCVYLTNGAALVGFTLTNGATRSDGDADLEQSGGGVWGAGSSAVVSNCTVTGNSAAYKGGGIYSGTVNNCALSGNAADNGGGIALGALNNCRLKGNRARVGGGASDCTLAGSALTGNQARESGGGVSGGLATNCTMTGNSAPLGGGAYSAELDNCIIYYNIAPREPNWSACTLNFSCTVPVPITGSIGNNTSAEPQLADASHLSAGSPCRGAGAAAFSVGADIDGDAWLNPPAIGCDEFQAASATGALAVAIQAAYTNVATDLPVNFTGQIDGHASVSVWDFGDGTLVSNRPYASHKWAALGDYTVGLKAYNQSNPLGINTTLTVHVVSPLVRYVSLSNTAPSSPFTSWATAATNIQDAIDASTVPGSLVLVSNGTYQTGGRVVGSGTLTNRVVVDKALTVRSVNGPGATVIAGSQMPGTTNIVEPVRCVYLADGAALAGFALANGDTRVDGDADQDQSGGGVWCQSGGVLLSNCFLTGNASIVRAGGAFGGTLVNCTLSNNFNRIWYGTAPGADFSTLNFCTIVSNYNQNSVGGVGDSTLNHCALIGNSSGYLGGGAQNCFLNDCSLLGNVGWEGGGAASCVLSNCTLTGNTAIHGGGASSSLLIRCTLTGNWTTEDNDYTSNGGGASGGTLFNCSLFENNSKRGGGAAGAALVNCTIVENIAPGEGGGVDGCTLTNCIVFGNTSPNGSNHINSTFYYCDTTPLPGLGANNIASDPLLADISHVSAASPTRAAGTASATAGTDIDGQAWLNPPSMGCDEFYSGSATGALSVAISETFTNVATGFVVDFAAQTTGHAASNRWNFGDGTSVSNRISVSHSWAAAGNYPVTFTTFNDSNPGGVSAAVTIYVLVSPVHYVSAASVTPVPPYLSWATAATNIQDAVDAAYSAGTIIVSNGVYQTGSRVLYGAQTNRVAVTKPLTVQSVNGAAVTVIDGGNSMRCLYLTNHVSVAGFTLRNGNQAYGAGAYCEAADDTVSDCILTGNITPAIWSGGGGGFGGIYNRCLLAGNIASYQGSGAYAATLNSCVLSNNGQTAYGGAASGCTLYNCLISSNWASWGGGVSGCTLYNCVLTRNATENGGGGSVWSTLNNCTVISNTAPSGAGVFDGEANNCIIYYNHGDNWMGDWLGISVNYSCTTPAAGGYRNITSPPAFVNLAGVNLRLQSNSPCINSGRNGYASAGPDLDGNPRIAGGTVDVGAYEYQTPTSIISYAWLQQHGYSINGSADHADPDGDHMSNWQEWQAGTDPANAASVLKLLPLSVTNNPPEVTVRWQSVSGVSYYVQRGTNLRSQPTFSILQSNLVGEAGTTFYIDSSPPFPGPSYYRVGVQP